MAHVFNRPSDCPLPLTLPSSLVVVVRFYRIPVAYTPPSMMVSTLLAASFLPALSLSLSLRGCSA